MCGIIGVVSKEETNISSLLMEGLKKIEYRGYDSSGMATIAENGSLSCIRKAGKLIALEKKTKAKPINGNIGIGHTRWATHGEVTKNNAHPHITDKVAVVHNGIIENFHSLRSSLQESGIIMKSETDSEVIPHLVTRFLESGMSPMDSVTATIKMLSGTFALAILFAGKKDLMIAVKYGSPLAIGYGDKRMYVGSDAIALSPFTSKISYLRDGDIAQITSDGVMVFDNDNKIVERQMSFSEYSSDMIEKGEHSHYMIKEIREQPTILSNVISRYLNPVNKKILMPEFNFDIAKVPQITIVACGTSHYAGMVCKYWIEKLTDIPVNVDIASEFRYRNAPLKAGGVSIFISQSGETADTLAALNFAKEKRQHIVSIVNVIQSTMAHASDVILPIFAGAEIGVASTKAFTAQLAVLAFLAIYIADAKKNMSTAERKKIINSMIKLPILIQKVLTHDRVIHSVARKISTAGNVLFIGRGTSYPIAMEGALKLKELTYIHAEGIAAGELKHGPLALVDKNTPIIAINPSDSLFDKTCSNIHEAVARKGNVIVLCDSAREKSIRNITPNVIVIPQCDSFISPIVFTVSLQLLAYYVAVAKGHNVDQPRNLAKSVTVE
ncbi:glutamine--fructose-6-phosphate transaminase (isomerizing) [Rickettsiales bacterium]|nr:glutamine--fructose-6-phosphate transaminase (isomerizing) [Rickettsiales bacterium]